MCLLLIRTKYWTRDRSYPAISRQSPWMFHVHSWLYGLAFDSKLGYVRKCVTPWTNGFLLSIQQRSVCQAGFTDSKRCDSDLPAAETEGRLPHVHGKTHNSPFAVLCIGLFLLLGTEIASTKIVVGISDHISFRWQFLMKSKAKPLTSELAYLPKIA